MAKIAIACRGGYVDENFACEYLSVATIENGAVVSETLYDFPEKETLEAEPTAVVTALETLGVTHFFVGHIGDEWLAKVRSLGVQVVRGVSGFATDVPLRWINGTITDSLEIVPLKGVAIIMTMTMTTIMTTAIIVMTRASFNSKHSPSF